MARVLDAMALDMLREVGSIGSGRAATSLAALTGTRVHMEVPRASLVALDAVGEQVGGMEKQLAAVHLNVSGDLRGHILYMMSPREATNLAALLIRGANSSLRPDMTLSELALSAMQEAGSILAASYLIALGQLAGLEARLSPPEIGIDMAGALVDGVLATAAAAADVVVLIETNIQADGLDEGGTFLFIPTPESLDLIIDRLSQSIGVA